MISINKNRVVSLVSASAMVATMALTVATPVFAGSAPKTTGDVWADRTAEGLGVAHMVFVAQGTSLAAKGTFTYSDAKGAYTIAVEAVTVEGSIAHFAGPVVSNNHPDIQSAYIGIAVKDGGEPGIGVDRVNGAGYSSLTEAIADFDQSPEYLTASAGNLQVHNHS